MCSMTVARARARLRSVPVAVWLAILELLSDRMHALRQHHISCICELALAARASVRESERRAVPGTVTSAAHRLLLPLFPFALAPWTVSVSIIGWSDRAPPARWLR